MDDLIRTHYHRQALPSDIRTRLVTIAQTDAAQQRQCRRLRRNAVAAAILLSSLCTWMLLAPAAETHAAAIAEAVAAQHRLAKPMTVWSADPDLLAQHFSDLSFTLQLPADPRFAGVAVRGGRRCTLGGAPAVHLRLLASNGQESSLFVADRRQIRLAPERIFCHDTGVIVELWSDANATYTWAVPISPTTPPDAR